MDDASRKLIYQNIASGVSFEAQARALGCSEQEVRDTFREVGLTFANWMLDDAVPYVPCQTQESAMQNRKKLLQWLPDLDLNRKNLYHRVRAARCAVEN